jgi:hypothetical protein
MTATSNTAYTLTLYLALMALNLWTERRRVRGLRLVRLPHSGQ